MTKKHWYPFNAEQTVNILSEFGPLVTMFIVNALYGIHAGTWALLISTVVAMVTMRMVLGKLPVFPIIASTVTIVFGVLTLLTGDPIWVQIKVTIFNAMFAGFLFGGLYATSPAVGPRSLYTMIAATALGIGLQIPHALAASSTGFPKIGDPENALTTNLLCLSTIVIGFAMGQLFRRNFFGHVFEKTFHYTAEGWDRFTYSFALFFLFTAFLNEAVRQIFIADQIYPVPFVGPMDGVNIWIMFKIIVIMPLSGLYAWVLTRMMSRYHL